MNISYNFSLRVSILYKVRTGALKEFCRQDKLDRAPFIILATLTKQSAPSRGFHAQLREALDSGR